MSEITVRCYFLCDCGMSHHGVFKFYDTHKFGQWILAEYTNIDYIVDIE